MACKCGHVRSMHFMSADDCVTRIEYELKEATSRVGIFHGPLIGSGRKCPCPKYTEAGQAPTSRHVAKTAPRGARKGLTVVRSAE